MASVQRVPNPWEEASLARHPFGLPLGSVRGIMALLILGFFWVAVCWPNAAAKLPLGHFFLLPLVLFSFVLPNQRAKNEGWGVLPVVLRILVTGGTIAVGIFAYQKGADFYKDRLTPRLEEVQEFWIPFAATLAGGFLFGHVMRLLLGTRSPLFITLRSWLGVVSLVMLLVDLTLLVMMFSSRGGDGAFLEFLRMYHFFEVGIVAAYFGARL